MSNSEVCVKMDSFPSDDGHIESVLIGCEDVKVSFQTWDSKALVIIFRDTESVFSSHSVYGDIGGFACSELENGMKRYYFKDAYTDETVLEIVVKFIEIYNTGIAVDINSALFDVGYDYIGNQNNNIK